MKKILLFLTTILCSLNGWAASEYEIGNFKYVIETHDGKTGLHIVGFAAGKNPSKIEIPTSISLSSASKYNVRGVNGSAFKGNTNITSVTFPESEHFKYINASAFEGCTGLTSITIPSGVGKISGSNDNGLHQYAFKGCTSLKTVTINSNTLMNSSSSSIGVGDAFLNATTINMGDNVTSIGAYSFHRSNGDLPLKTITFSDNLKYIYSNAFENAKKLDDVDLKNVEYLGKNAFEGCDALKTVRFRKLTSDENFPSSVTVYNIDEIPSNLKLSSTFLKTIHFGPNVTRIPEDLFIYTGHLHANKVCQNVFFVDCAYEGVEIGFNAFSGLKNLAIFGGKPSKIGTAAFRECSKLKSNIFENNLYFEQCTEIGNGAFEGCTLFDLSLGSKNTPLEILTYVGDEAFKGCENLPSVNIPNAEVGSKAFSGCTTISSATVKSIQNAEKVFEGCTNLKDITFCSNIPAQKNDNNMIQKIGSIVETIAFSDEVTSIGDYAFSNYGVTNVSFNKVKTIGVEAFARCANFTSANGLSNVETLGKGVFYNCKNLKGDNISSISMGNVTKIPDNAFYGCSSLTTLKASNVTEIGEYAFEGCTKLNGIHTITSKENVTIGKRAFYGCTALQYNPVKNAKSIGQLAFYNCSKLSQPYLENTDTIGAGAFQNCTNLTSLWYTDLQNVVSIGSGAFENTGITSVTLPNTLTELGTSAFSSVNQVKLNCPELLKKPYTKDNNLLKCFGIANGDATGYIEIGDDVTEIGEYAFYNNTYKSRGAMNVEHISIGNGVKKLGKSTFYGFNAKNYISIGSGLNLQDCIKYNDLNMTCENLVEIYNPCEAWSNALKKDQNFHTLFGKNVKKYIIGIGYNNASLQFIPTYAFYTEEETALETVVFNYNNAYSENLTLSILYDAFKGNQNLSYINLNRVAVIMDRAFMNCIGLTSLIIGNDNPKDNKVKLDIGENAFYGCTGLSSIEIKDDDANINASAFTGVKPFVMIDMSDKATLPSVNGGETIFITNQEAHAKELREEKIGGVKKYKYVTSVQRMGCEPADVNMDGNVNSNDITSRL